MKKGETPETTGEKIKNIVSQFGFEDINNTLDLRNRSNEEVMKFFASLVKLETVVFHGTNAKERFDTLEARRANDSSKESGNKKAVYASTEIETPLILALLNEDYLKNKFDHYTTGWSRNKRGRRISKFTPNVYELLKSGDTNMFSDGYIYVLDKANFVNAEDAGAEWHSEVNQKPILTCRISRKLAKDIFILGQGDTDTVFEYSPEEIEQMDKFDKKRDEKENKKEIESR